MRASIRIVPHDEILIASDRRLHTGETTRPDHVAGVHGPSLTLVALDGAATGRVCARRRDRIGHPGNPRGPPQRARRRDRHQPAGTQLRGIQREAERSREHRAPLRQLLRACRGKPLRARELQPTVRDLPETAYLFRDSGLAGDTVSRDVVRRAPAALEEGPSRRCSSAGSSLPARTGRRRCASGSTGAAAMRGSSTTARTIRSRTPATGSAMRSATTRRRTQRRSTTGSATLSASGSRESRPGP